MRITSLPEQIPVAPDLRAAAGARISISTNSLYFGSVKKGTSSQRYFNLQNTGEQAAQVYLSAPYGFSLSQSSVRVPPKGSVTVTVTFTPGFVKDYFGFINCTGSAASVMLSGKGVP